MASAELQKIVTELEIVKRPLQSSRSAGKSGNVVPHEGCVATTSDGQKYLIEKGVAPDYLNELHRIGGPTGSRIVKIGSKMPSDFMHVKNVKVTRTDATLNDLLEASGISYNALCNNCWNSTESMQQVVTDELQLPWQMKAGINIGILGVIVMALFAIGKVILGGPKRLQ